MPSLLSRKSGLEDLKVSEMRFVKELLADDLWRPGVAARKAGYKNPTQTANQLIKKPKIAKLLGREQRRRLEKLELKAEDVLHVLATGLFFNPLSLFKPSASGKWLIEDLDKIPDDIGRIIEEIKTRTVDAMDDEGNVTTTTYFELKTISKSKLLELAMKHCGVDGTQKIEYSGNVDMQVHLSGGINALLMSVEATRASQVIDQRIVEDAVDVE